MAETSYAPDPRPSPGVLPPDGRVARRFTYRLASVNATPQRILAVDATRTHAILQTPTGSAQLFLARSSGVSSSSPNSWPPSTPFEVQGFEDLWAATAGTTIAVSILEFFNS